MAILTTANKTQLNKMNRVAKNVSLGTVLGNMQTQLGASGSVTLSATQANASAVVIATGLSSVKGYIVQRVSSGSHLGGLYIDNTSASLTITTGSSGQKLATTDTLMWMAW